MFMARCVGQAGRYVSQRAAILRKRMWVTAASGLITPLGVWPIVMAFAAAILDLAKGCFALLDYLAFDNQPRHKRPVAEAAVGLALEQFPDEFRVIHDVPTASGNLDHVVVGPTGVFVLETKNWLGIVASDGTGELTLNGKPLDQPYVDRFVARVMEVKEKIQGLASDTEAYFQPVFVFTSARVDAGFGTTGAAHCICDERLFDYIVNKRFGRKLPVAEIRKIAEALVALAQRETASAGGFAPAPACTGKAQPRPFSPQHPRTRPVLAAA